MKSPFAKAIYYRDTKKVVLSSIRRRNDFFDH